MNETFALTLKEARKSKGFTQIQLAETLFVTRQTVSNWENGRSEPDLEMLKRLTELLEIDLDSAFGKDKNVLDESTAVQNIVDEEASQEEVVQPSPGARWKKWVPLALAVLMVVIGLGIFTGKGEIHYSKEWFFQGSKRQEGQSWLEMYLRNNNAQIITEENGKKSIKKVLVIREEGGVGLQVEEIRVVFFFTDKTHDTAIYNKEMIAWENKSTHIDKYGLMRFFVGMPVEMDKELLGVGIHVKGVDDIDHQLEFRYYTEKYK